MSVIAHWIEQQDISTVVIGSVKLHLEKIKPPRALWVPFEYGRPLGPPANSKFQLEVITRALSLIETQRQASVIVDFDKDDPRAQADPEWQPPDIAPAESIEQEIVSLKQHYQRQCVDKSRTAVGVSKVPIAEAAKLIDAIIAGEPPSSARDGISPTVMTRLAIDDLKAYYIEAALADGLPSSSQIHDWLWKNTLLGRRMKAVRQRLMNSNDPLLASMVESYSVPHRWRDPA